MTGKPYRLLTEAEYEYATRAGTKTKYPWGNEGSDGANCNGCIGLDSKWFGKIAPIGSFPPNQFGLYDMLGNVWEWVEDCYHANYETAPTDGSAWTCADDSYRAARGGYFNTRVEFLNSGFRARFHKTNRGDILGFRVGRSLGR
jgi:formylglycine-generating enzyme required for sulfatase activity